MRIGIVCSRLDMAGGGGMERLARDIIEGLADRGIRPVVLTRRVDPRLPLLAKLDEVKVIPVKLIPVKLRDRYFSWQVDKWKQRLGLDLILSCHRTANADISVCGGNHIGFLNATGKTPSLWDKLHIAQEKQQYATAKKIIANSRLMQEELAGNYGVDPGKITVLYPSIDTDLFRPVDAQTRQALRASYGFSPDKKIFAFPSGDHGRKGLAMIRSFFENTDLPVELVVAGRPAEPGRNVRSLGFLSHIETLFQAVDATILASLYEPFGMVGIESICCGTPAVFSDNMACCEIAREPAMIQFSRARPDTLAEAIDKIIQFDRAEHPDLRSCIDYDVSKKAFVDGLLRLIEHS